jgi:hypothetical protein
LQQFETVDTSDSVETAIVKEAVQNPDKDMFFKWAAVYHNISKIFHDLHTENYREIGIWKDEKTDFFCDISERPVRKADVVFLVSKGRLPWNV